MIMPTPLRRCSSAVAAWRRRFLRNTFTGYPYRAILEKTTDGILLVAASKKTLYANRTMRTRLGRRGEEFQRLSLDDVFIDANGQLDDALRRCVQGQEVAPICVQERAMNGHLNDVEVQLIAIRLGRKHGIALISKDVSKQNRLAKELLKHQERLDLLAYHDQLTGLPNRHFMNAFLPAAIELARAGNKMVAVALIDLDRFSDINNTRGHEAGDMLLREVARKLRSGCRENDATIRMGGDEFVAIFTDVDSLDDVARRVDRILGIMKEPVLVDRQPLQATASIGVSLFPSDGTSLIDLLKHADTAMYHAKALGRNNAQYYVNAMQRHLEHRVNMEAALRDAVRLQQLEVYYQPIVELATQRVVAMEALIRWHHPVEGMIPPDEFIPIAEEIGLDVDIGDFVLQQSVRDLIEWDKKGAAIVPVSVNITPLQLQGGRLRKTVCSLLEDYGLQPVFLQLELTERALFASSVLSPDDGRGDAIAEIRSLGCKIAIDDFGTGYSNLSYLRRWKIDAVKIDQSFVQDLSRNSSDSAIVSAIIAIAKNLGIRVVAEGVETAEQTDMLIKLGCTLGQGFFFSRPARAEDCLGILGCSGPKAIPPGGFANPWQPGG
jgi:diguanylate cyclase (GGDEF)-like protein/PAS domain S-box-containing protein